MSKTTFEDILEKDGKLVYKNVGKSMLPLIRENRDIIIIEKKTRKPRKYDVALYKKEDGRYILHRIVKATSDGGYVIRGDNCYYTERDIKEDDIIGVLSGIVRNGKELSITDFSYRLYSFVWCNIYAFRLALKIIIGLIKRLFRKICGTVK